MAVAVAGRPCSAAVAVAVAAERAVAVVVTAERAMAVAGIAAVVVVAVAAEEEAAVEDADDKPRIDGEKDYENQA